MKKNNTTDPFEGVKNAERLDPEDKVKLLEEAYATREVEEIPPALPILVINDLLIIGICTGLFFIIIDKFVSSLF